MIRFLRYLIFGDAHIHQYEEKERVIVRTDDNLILKTQIIQECKICKNLRSFRLDDYGVRKSS